MPDAVIFDLDGTLVDSVRDIAEAMNHVLRTAGYPAHPLASYAAFVGEGSAVLVRRAAPAHADDTVLLQAFLRRYEEHCVDTTAPYPGIADLCRRLSAREMPLAVLSNKPHAMTLRVVDACFGPGVFGAVAGERAGVPRKPDPAGALGIAASLQVAPHACWLVGDTPIDVRTAAAAGMRSIAVSWGLRNEMELRAAAPDHLVHEVAALEILLSDAPRHR